MISKLVRWLLIVMVAVVLVAGACVLFYWWNLPKPGQVKDEALLAGRDASSFPPADEDDFHDMDGGAALNADEIKGRNTWIVWTAGDDRLWDKLIYASAGALDFLKVLSSHPELQKINPNFSHDHRWEYLGLVLSLIHISEPTRPY